MKRKNNATGNRLSPLTAVMLFILSVYVVSLLGLLFWGVMTSFKPNNISGYAQLTSKTYKLPSKWVWNYTDVFKKFVIQGVDYPKGMVRDTLARDVGMGMMFGYSVLYAVGCALASTLVQCITAYLCARFPCKVSKMVYTIVLVVMIAPTVGSLPSEIQMARTFGLYGHIYGLWVMKANFLGMYFLVFYSVFRAMPMAYTEAAKVDGAGNCRIMFRIVFPLVRNTFFTILLINFITFWNDYQTPLKFMPYYPTVAYGLYYMTYVKNTKGMANAPYKMTSAIMVLTPVIILFLIFQKRLLGNLTVGGVKG